VKKFVLGAVAVTGLAAVAPAVAQAPTVNISISKPSGGPQGTITTAIYGQSVRLSGEVSNGQAGETVLITVAPYGGEESTRQVVTEAGGDFEVSHRPTIRTSYTARWRGSVSGQEPYTHVRPAVSLRTLNARTGRFYVRVRADASKVSRTVNFQRRVSASAWKTVKRVKIGASLQTRFTARLPVGTSRVRILVPQKPGYLQGTSAFVKVTR
jgi:hypothetical protein